MSDMWSKGLNKTQHAVQYVGHWNQYIVEYIGHLYRRQALSSTDMFLESEARTV